MPFKPDEHANLGYVDKIYKDKLDALRHVHKRNIKDELEWLIDAAFRAERVTLPPMTLKKVVDK